MTPIQECIKNKKVDSKPIWFMRQAGRYLPEFRKIRSQNQNFIKLCFNSELSSEITLQPITRFDLDSAIIFSDILLVPHVLGQNVKFVKDKGPVLDTFNMEIFLNNNPSEFTKKMSPVYQAIHQESDVVPENIDAIRAMCNIESDSSKSVKKTNQALGID